MQQKISPEEISEWLQNSVTQLYFKRLKQQAIIRREMAAYGGIIKDTSYETGEAYIKAMIQAEVYEACAEPSLEDIVGEDE